MVCVVPSINIAKHVIPEDTDHSCAATNQLFFLKVLGLSTDIPDTMGEIRLFFPEVLGLDTDIPDTLSEQTNFFPKV